MNLSSHLRRTIRRLLMILLLGVAGGAAGAAYAAVKTPTYTAKAYVVATASRSDPATALNFAQAYGRIATSGPVLAVARARLTDASGLPAVRSATSPDAPVVEIIATSPDARHSADLANAVAGALSEYAAGRSVDTNVKLSVLAPATVPDRPTSPRPPLESGIGAVAGLLIGALLALGGRAEPAPAEPAPAQPAPAQPAPAQPAPAEPAPAQPAPAEPAALAPPAFALPVLAVPPAANRNGPPARVVGRASVEEDR